jgi:precorrin-6Y C5,15-methyltransferase (decarboxylating)
MKTVTVIGMGMSKADLTRRHLDMIARADILVGGKRHLADFKDSPAIKKAITKKLTDLVAFIKKEMQTKRIVVLASGDPLFYGIGPRLVKSLGEKNVRLYPNVNSVAAAFAHIGEAWHDARVVSLHGRSNAGDLVNKLAGADTIAIFTDPVNNPARIAKTLVRKKMTGFDMWVFEQMGTDREKVKRYTLAGAARGKFTTPNMVVLKRTAGKKPPAAKLVLGTPDHLFAHERGLITKAEVRTVSLSKLRLEKNHVLWDIGAGSGSVSIEAALFITGGKIFALEKSESRISLIKENLKTFKVTNLKTVLADFPQENLRLPAPDRIFIGGGGRNLKAIIKAGAAELKKNGRMVINTVLIANIETAVKALEQSGFKAEVAQVQVSKSKDMPWSTRLEAQNPVWIITGQREKATT